MLGLATQLRRRVGLDQLSNQQGTLGISTFLICCGMCGNFNLACLRIIPSGVAIHKSGDWLEASLRCLWGLGSVLLQSQIHHGDVLHALCFFQYVLVVTILWRRRGSYQRNALALHVMNETQQRCELCEQYNTKVTHSFDQHEHNVAARDAPVKVPHTLPVDCVPIISGGQVD